MKTCLLEGYNVTFKRDARTINVRQGPESHRRTAPFGVVLSVISATPERTDLAKKIDREKFIYLIKSGEDHATYASFDQYQLPQTEPANCPLPSPPQAPTPQFILGSYNLSIRTMRALSYGGGALAVQSFWWVSRNAVWLRYPILIAGAISILTFSCVTPASIAEWVMSHLKQAGGEVLRVVAQVSKTWLGDPWLWFTVCLVVLVVWWLKQPVCNREDPESEDSPRKPPPSVPPQKKGAPNSPPPRASVDVPTDTDQPTMPCVVPEVPPRPLSPLATRHGTSAHSHGLVKCQADLLRSNHQPIARMGSEPCVDVAAFVVPVATGDNMRCIPLVSQVGVISDGRTVMLCARHWDLYNREIIMHLCHVPLCPKDGLPIPVHEGMVFECIDHTKLRILN